MKALIRGVGIPWCEWIITLLLYVPEWISARAGWLFRMVFTG